jgi:tyrosine-protein phosphatase SIW14
MEGTKKADIPVAMMRSIVELVVDRRNHPVLIHCNQGKHRTGCVVGVVRKYNGWDNDSVLAEYTRFAEPKVRETDVNYLNNFKLTSLRNIVSRRIDGPRMNLVQFMMLVLVSGLCLTLWLLTANQLILPSLSQTTRRTLRAVRSAKAMLE